MRLLLQGRGRGLGLFGGRRVRCLLVLVLFSSLLTVSVAASEPGSESGLVLADFDVSGLEVELAGLVVAGSAGSQRALFSAEGSRWDQSGSLADGELGLGVDESPVVRIMSINSGAVLRLNDAGLLVLRDYFGVSGEGADLTVHIETADGEASFAVAGNVDSAGSSYVNFDVPTEARSVLNSISDGDRFILALTRPAPQSALAQNTEPVEEVVDEKVAEEVGDEEVGDEEAVDQEVEVVEEPEVLAEEAQVLVAGPTPQIITARALVVDEGRVNVAVLAAVDDDTLTADLEWTLAGGADQSHFELAAMGVLTFAQAKDFEQSDDADGDGTYDVTVQVGDGGHITTADLAVTLVDIDETTTAPPPPAALTVVEAGASAVTVRWVAPAHAGSPITGYDLQYRTVDETDWTDGPQDVDSTTAKIVELAADVNYQVRVRSSDATSQGRWSEYATGTTAFWEADLRVGAARHIRRGYWGYQDRNRTTFGALTPDRVTYDGVEYVFTLLARYLGLRTHEGQSSQDGFDVVVRDHALGDDWVVRFVDKRFFVGDALFYGELDTGDPTDPVEHMVFWSGDAYNPELDEELPVALSRDPARSTHRAGHRRTVDGMMSTLTDLRASVSYNRITLNWTAPSRSDITGYQVWRGPDEAGLVIVADDTAEAVTSYVDDTVTAQTDYVYVVSAVTDTGIGPRSAPVFVTAGPARVLIWSHSFASGVLDAGSPVSYPGIDARVSEPGAPWVINLPDDSIVRVVSVATLGAGDSFYLTVRGNGSGLHDYSMVLQVGDRELLLSDAVILNGIFGTTYVWPEGGADWTVGEEVQLGLLYQPYESAPVLVRSQRPGRPTGVALAGSGVEELTVTWDAPSNAAETELEEYHVFLKRLDDAWSQAESRVFTPLGEDGERFAVAFPDLVHGVEYHAVVYPRNALGYGPRGVSRPAQAPKPPPDGAVRGLSLVSDNAGELTISWKLPNPEPSDYRISWAEESLEFLSYADTNEAERGNEYPEAPGTSMTLTGLTKGATFKVQARARYDNGGPGDRHWSGPWSGAVTATVAVDPPPAKPTGLTALMGNTGVLLEWDDPQNPAITGHQILRGGSSTNDLDVIVADSGTGDSWHLDDTAAARRRYDYAVRAITAGGVGEQSELISVKIPETPVPVDVNEVDDPPVIARQQGAEGTPASPTGVTTTGGTDRITVTWDDPGDNTITGYAVQRYNRYGDYLDSDTLLTADTGDHVTSFVDHLGIVPPSETPTETRTKAPSEARTKAPTQARTTRGVQSTVDQLTVEQHALYYQYRVYALNERGASESSPWSRHASPRPQDGTPARPLRLQAFAGNSKVTLWWDDPGDSTITGYRILRGTAEELVVSRTVAENATGNVGAAFADTATVGDGDTLTYSVVAAAGSDAAAHLAAFNDDFLLDAASGQISVRPGGNIDFEERSRYVVVLQAAYNKVVDSLDGTVTLTVTVTNANDAGSVSISGAPQTGQTLAASVSDPDGTVSNVSWQWASAASATGPFTRIDGATGASYLVAAGDTDRFLRATASYTDPLGSGRTAAATTAQVDALNSAPTFSAMTATRTVAEDTTTGNVGAAFTATDSDGDTLTYSVAAGTGSGAADHLAAFNDDFLLDAASGQVSFRPGGDIDFEDRASYVVVLKVTDNKNTDGSAGTDVDDTLTLTVTVLDVFEKGSVSLSGHPWAGATVKASLSDPNGPTMNRNWRWFSSASASGPFTEIDGATVGTYQIKEGDTGRYLRARVIYRLEGGDTIFNAATDFKVARPTDSSRVFEAPFALLELTASTKTPNNRYADTNVSSGEPTYTYAIEAINANGRSRRSATISIKLFSSGSFGLVDIMISNRGRN